MTKEKGDSAGSAVHSQKLTIQGLDIIFNVEANEKDYDIKCGNIERKKESKIKRNVGLRRSRSGSSLCGSVYVTRNKAKHLPQTLLSFSFLYLPRLLVSSLNISYHITIFIIADVFI